MRIPRHALREEQDFNGCHLCLRFQEMSCASSSPIVQTQLKNPFTAVTEKMTQTFTMAFTAKCAECSVCERSTACNLSGLFYILYKESAPLCFLHCCSQCLWEESRDERCQLRSFLDLLLSPTFLHTLYINVACSYVLVCSLELLTAVTQDIEVSSGEQLTNKAGVHANRPGINR